jgi:hypothetical protein
MLKSSFKSLSSIGRYVFQMERTRFNNGEGGVERGTKGGFSLPEQELTEAARRQAVASGYQGSVNTLLDQGKKVVLIYPIPEVGWDVPKRIFRLYKRGIYDPVTTDIKVFRQRTAAVFAAFDGIADRPSLLRIYPHSLLCNTLVEGRCATAAGKTIYYRDQCHLSPDGGELLLAHIFDQVIQQWGEL